MRHPLLSAVLLLALYGRGEIVAIVPVLSSDLPPQPRTALLAGTQRHYNALPAVEDAPEWLMAYDAADKIGWPRADAFMRRRSNDEPDTGEVRDGREGFSMDWTGVVRVR